MTIYVENSYATRVINTNEIMKDKVRKNMRINTVAVWNNGKCGVFDIINDISLYVMLVQVMETLGNFSHSVSISGV